MVIKISYHNKKFQHMHVDFIINAWFMRYGDFCLDIYLPHSLLRFSAANRYTSSGDTEDSKN